MKFALLIFVAISTCSFSQDKKAVVSATKLNVLYRGIENPIELGAEGISPDKLNVTITNGTITKKSGTDYVIVPGNDDTVKVILSVNKKVIGEKVFRVKEVPEPYPSIDIQRGDGLYSTIINENNSISAKKPEGFELEAYYKVLSFSIVISDSLGNTIKEYTDGNYISANQTSLIAKQKIGQNIFFTDILVLYPSGRIRKICDMCISIQ